MRLPSSAPLALALALGCGAPTQQLPSPDPVPAAAQTPPPAAAPSTPLQTEMQTHYSFATNARDAVIHADLAGARLWGRGLAEQPAPEGLPPHLRPLLAEMQTAAVALSEAPDLDAAGKRVGDLALSCAECHEFSGGGPKVLALPIPPQDFRGGTEMAMHKWSTEWLWFGLIANDTEAWSRGAKALEEQPFQQFPHVEKKDADQMDQLVHLVASLAKPGDRADQALRFGQTITACAMCHVDATKSGVKAPTTPAPEVP